MGHDYVGRNLHHLCRLRVQHRQDMIICATCMQSICNMRGNMHGNMHTTQMQRTCSIRATNNTHAAYTKTHMQHTQSRCNMYAAYIEHASMKYTSK